VISMSSNDKKPEPEQIRKPLDVVARPGKGK
jgi:hypothetical protein